MSRGAIVANSTAATPFRLTRGLWCRRFGLFFADFVENLDREYTTVSSSGLGVMIKKGNVVGRKEGVRRFEESGWWVVRADSSRFA